MLSAMAKHAPAGSKVTETYEGNHPLLVVYGGGALDRKAWIQQHIESGGQVVCFDLGYWQKDTLLRVSIGSTQPLPEHIRSTKPEPRWFPGLRDDYYNAGGHVVIVGIGPKTRVQYGLDGPEWELAALERLKERFPLERIVFRPKGHDRADIGCRIMPDGPIENVLRGAALIVCRHSNVAVDACIAGIPVECEGGAGLALYENNPKPSVQERTDFLKRLAMWQWSATQAPQAWRFLAGRLLEIEESATEPVVEAEPEVPFRPADDPIWFGGVSAGSEQESSCE